jgi:hypothetical protein
MTKKQFALIVLLWALVMTVIFVTPARSGDVGIIQAQGAPTCQQAKGDLLAVGVRYMQLKKEFEAEQDPHFRVALAAELKALGQLGGKIIMWRTENCKDSDSQSSSSS